MLAADEAAGWVVLEQIEGRVLAPGRRSDTTEVAAIVELQRALRDYPARALPASPVRRALQTRFLEDPSDPIGWITHGLERAASRKLLPAAVAQTAIDVIVSYGDVRFAHGDLLPRNIVMTPEGPVLIDWECAGPMLSTWDPALLYISIPATRAQLPRSAVLYATVLFALARELAFLHAFPQRGSSPRYEQLRREIAEASAKLIE